MGIYKVLRAQEHFPAVCFKLVFCSKFITPPARVKSPPLLHLSGEETSTSNHHNFNHPLEYTHWTTHCTTASWKVGVALFCGFLWAFVSVKAKQFRNLFTVFCFAIYLFKFVFLGRLSLLSFLSPVRIQAESLQLVVEWVKLSVVPCSGI